MQEFGSSFMRNHVLGTEPLDLAPLFLEAGVVLHVDRSEATLGNLNREPMEAGLRVAQPTPSGSPAYDAGLCVDDELLSVAEYLPEVLKRHKVDDTVELVFKRRGELKYIEARLVSTPTLTLTPTESTGRKLTQAQSPFVSLGLRRRLPTSRRVGDWRSDA